MKQEDDISTRIAEALERLAPAKLLVPDFDAADAFIWNIAPDQLVPVTSVKHVDIKLLQAIDQMRDILSQNTQQFANGFPANNALLWGARGMGKSALVKALHAIIRTPKNMALALIEIHREDISSLPRLLNHIRNTKRRVILFCDDLSFDDDDSSYKSLKAVLEGGILGRPENVIFYATSNRRHLMPRPIIENERSTATAPAESVEEKVSLSDRFGLWLGFHSCAQGDYLAMIDGYLDYYNIEGDKEIYQMQALEWAKTRGARSGRVAWQFIQDLAGRHKITL
ncbi:ATP-DEPENDENT PROTEASE SUBUNIT [hydrothermal vent metagenome]|uniref:ATP-DEPENDENT PROTEASE SUBUNIT n=1 Tax=hydrothermal vent metagenome TaxID=652676 RepID=A0A3B1AXP8_9ZZZZ